MNGKPIRLVCIGKIKTDFWKEACQTYEKRLTRYRRYSVTELRDAESAPSNQRRNELECSRILAACQPQDPLLVMDERGRDLTSRQLADLLKKLDLEAAGTPTFVIGGPFGLTDEVRSKARMLLRLSAMTFPHEMARVILTEQLYRAECILHGVPYHH